MHAHTNRHIDTEIDRQMDRQTDIHTCTHTLYQVSFTILAFIRLYLANTGRKINLISPPALLMSLALGYKET